MKKIYLILLMFLFSINIFAQNWTKDTKKEFKKSKQVAIVVDFTKATIWDMSYDEFLQYNKDRADGGDHINSLLFTRASKQIANDFGKTFKKIIVDPQSDVFTIHFVFKEISEQAGFKGFYYVEINGNVSRKVTFKHKDGKWNDFETLLLENVRELIKRTLGQEPSLYIL